MEDLEYAVKEKQTEEHNVITEAIRDRAAVPLSQVVTNIKGYTVFSVPVGVIYRPSEAKIKNAQKKDYLGQAKLIAATDAKDGFTGFTGAEIKKVRLHSIELFLPKQAQEPARSPPTNTTSPMNFKTHAMIKTNIASSRSMRARAQSDAGMNSASVTSAVSSETRREKFQKPFPVKAGSGADREMPKNLPPTPPSEPESGYGNSLQRTRSRSTPARSRSLAARSSGSSTGSSDYAPPVRSRLDTVRDEEDDFGGSQMRRTRSTGGRDRTMNRSLSTRTPRGRREDKEGLDDIYGDYYEEKPLTRTPTTRRPLARAMSRSRASSSSRARSREDEESQRYYSDNDEDDEFEMVTPKRSEITKVSPA